jgi:hypothetical protein
MDLPKLNFLSRIIKKDRTNKDRPQKQEYSPSPTPEEILKSGMPGKSFQGLLVAWDLTVRNIAGEISRHEILMLTSFERIPGSIWLVVDISKFPDILHCPAGKRISVKGEITSVKDQDINLKDCQIADIR